MKFDIKTRWSGDVQFVAEIHCDDDVGYALKVGLAVKWALKNSANLRSADLRSADLSGANLRSANLRSANLSGAKALPALVSAQTTITPQGELIGFKKLADGTICKLKIPADAKRSNASDRKCRAEYAIVLEGEGVSQYASDFSYRIGETVRPREPFDENRWNECSSGIHFFLTEEEAKAY